MSTDTQDKTIAINDKFVACWGYDQTQYSVYNVVAIKGKSVVVEGLNGWSSLSDSDLAEGSQVKVYEFKNWFDLSEDDRADLSSRGFDHNSYAHHYRKDAIDQADTRTITKVQRIDGQKWTYIWTLDNGQVVRSDDRQALVKVVRGLKKCLVNTKYGSPSIKINESIRPYLDKDYNRNSERYQEQNEYTAYNGR